MGVFNVREECVFFSKMGILFIALIYNATCKVLKVRRMTDVMLISAEFKDVAFDTSNKR
jgi:hypothetical protein